MTTLRNTVTEPDGTTVDGWLDVATVGNPFRAGTQTEVLGPIKDRTFTGGAWSVELVPGLYVVTQRRRTGAVHSRWTVQVPDSEFAVWLADCLVTVPGTPASLALLGISSAFVDASGHLQLVYTDGTTVDAGSVAGPQGLPWTGSAAEFDSAMAAEINDASSAARGALDNLYGGPSGGTIETAAPMSTLTVSKDPVTGFWPSGWVNDKPIYTGGSANAGVRPTARDDLFVQWKGPDPSPGSVTSGAGGMRDGLDTRFVTP